MNLIERDWLDTSVRHEEPCGCRYRLLVEIGNDYHEAWQLIVRCARHAKAIAS